MFNTNEEHTLWVERHRPSKLEDYVGNDHLKSKVQGWLASGDIPHLLLYGKPGTGKCLDFSEEIDIEMELSEEEALQLSRFIFEK
jgi:DNA polymerase III delta prime subunit